MDVDRNVHTRNLTWPCDERNNLEVLSSVFSVLGKEEKFHFVKDRAGHDWRYSLDDRKIRKLGWSPKIDFDTGIEHIANHY